MTDNAWVPIVIASALLSSILSMAIQESCDTDRAQHEAIKHHAGKYVSDPLTGALKFKWNDELEKGP